MPNQKTLLVLGAGPKAIALAAKVAVLNELGCSTPHLRIFDPAGIGSNWTGRHGLTNGTQPLGTSPEKDLGFPYASTCWSDGTDDFNPRVNRDMMRLSWIARKIATGQLAQWVDRSKPQPSHGEWAKYLNWAAQEAKAVVVRGTVTKIDWTPDGKQWQLDCTDAGNTVQAQGDGLVITGPGDDKLIDGHPCGHPRVYGGRDVWLNLDAIGRMLRPGDSIALIGPGETTASIALALHELSGRLPALQGHPAPTITFICPSGVPYTRGESFSENRFYSNPDDRSDVAWADLTIAQKREFIRRTDRGVFSVHAKRYLDQCEEMRVVCGRATTIQPGPNDVAVGIEGRAGPEIFQIVVVAKGFDEFSFRRLVPVGHPVMGCLATPVIERDLGLQGLFPRLHLPMAAAMDQGPGFPNLSCLGLLADRILQQYVLSPNGLPLVG